MPIPQCMFEVTHTLELLRLILYLLLSVENNNDNYE